MHNDKQYVLVIKTKWLAFGPFHTLADAEYAAMDYYGTPITGASMRGEFLIAELRGADDLAVRPKTAALAAGAADD